MTRQEYDEHYKAEVVRCFLVSNTSDEIMKGVWVGCTPTIIEHAVNWANAWLDAPDMEFTAWLMFGQSKEGRIVWTKTGSKQ